MAPNMRSRKKRHNCEDIDTAHKTSASQEPNDNNNYLDHEISQLTRLRSFPHELLSRAMPGRSKLPVSTVKMLVGREGNYSGKGRFSSADGCHVLSRYLPVNGPWMVDYMKSRAYTSQFSSDGSLLVAGFQESQIRIYDVNGGWKVLKDILAKSLRWTVTDTSLSPDQHYLVYASMSPVVHIVNIGSATTDSVANVTEIHDGLDFSRNDDEEEFGIFSIKFSTDGRELVAASSDEAIYVYDLMENKLSLRIPAHTSDVNTVCFADETGHLIYSGSDDTLCKVWDRRCFISRGQAAGVLMGHLEGVAFIDSRGDGRHFISNGKDQTTKLWDIRKMSNATYKPRLRDFEWDYRWMEYPSHARNMKHPFDQSVATYRGHSVLRTLIRCHFSPQYSTGQKYIYTGSSDGSVYIYDLVSGDEVAKLDHNRQPVRDCTWHPVYPMIVTASWDGVVSSWEFPGSGEAPPPRKRKSLKRALYY
ncbi:LEC14B [Tripterygium wilfordii]|uniref:LEC14B homolog n=1 Tax=Tripterygium wilfordii TaxID=458696 RepID=A0A7J7CX99_TRIWF|nr:LEC14B homolog [Tripterygium wilfordii]XP_038721646.1 LEC14B homolog [Tripterygium wilfordii]KAF5738664.1 LEC14B [Tripterygium wilfordii]